MKYKLFMTPLYAEADDAAGGGDGLSARLEAFMAGNQFDDKGNVLEPEPIKASAPKDPTPPVDPTPPADPAPSDPPPADPAAGEEEEDDLPIVGSKKEPVQNDLSKMSFDEQTEAIVKAIEAKGHPGDEYRRLRAELKAANEKKSQVDIETLPEVAELRAKAAEADRLKAEADALRERQRELLQANDEVAVKESDEYINSVRKPLSDMEQIVAQMAESVSVDPDALFSIITEGNIIKQDQMLEALHQKVGPRAAGRIERLCDDFKAIQSKSASMLAEAGKNAERARLAREQAAKEEVTRKTELFRSSVEASFTEYAKRIPGYTDSTGNLTDVAKAAIARTTSVDITALAPEDLGYMAFASNALVDARKAIVKLQKENALLKGTRTPPTPIGGNTTPPSDSDDPYEGLAKRMEGKEFVFNPPQ